MLTAYDVAKDLDSNPDGTYRFGMSKERLVKELHALADAIEKDTVLPQKVMNMTIARLEDFPMTRVSLTFYEKDATRYEETT